jgi:MFS transporter, DHA1 family, solute carrier family 18 (vesicular amine transporter), member 1/2
MATVFLLASFVVTPVMGWLADRVGYRTVLGLSLLTYAGLLAAYVPVTSPEALIALRALEGVSAAGVLPPARALMNTVAPSERCGEALGLISTARYVGILAGPAVGSLLASVVGYTPAFLAASGVLTLTTLAVFLFLRPLTDMPPRAVAPAPAFSHGFTAPLGLAYGLAVVLAWPQGVTPAIWSLYMQDRGASLLLIGLSYTAFALAASALAPVAGRISDRYGRWRSIVAGLALSGVVYCIYGLRLPPGWIVAIIVVEGAGLAVARAAADGFLADHVPQGLQGRIHALFSAAGTAGSLVGAMVSGVLYAIEPGMPLLAMGVLYLLVPVALLMVPARRHLCGVGDATNSLELSEGGRVWRGCSIDLGELECDHAAGRDDQPGRLGHRGAALRRGGSPPVA